MDRTRRAAALRAVPRLPGSRRMPARWDDRGATAVEYSLLVVLIAVVIAGTVAALGTSVLNAFQSMIGAF